jgi:hypothetical protein
MGLGSGKTFLTYKGGRWLWISLLCSVGFAIPYLNDQSRGMAYGGSTIGLLYGVIGTLIIAVLMYLGIRKRSYASGVGTLRGWVSAHVYLGLMTLVIIPMHAGFRFGLDVHTLAFVLLAVVVLSGVLGVVLYQILPVRLTKYETGLQADKIDSEIHRLISDMRAIVKDKSDALVKLYQDEIDSVRKVKSKGWALLFSRVGDDQLAVRTASLSSLASSIPDADQPAFQMFSQLLLKKTQLEVDLMHQMRLRNALQAWLYVHVPVSVAMLVAVGIHIFVVFWY